MFTVGECRGLHRRHVERRGVEVGEDFRVARLGRPPRLVGWRLRGKDHAHIRMTVMGDCRGGRISDRIARSGQIFEREPNKKF